MPGAACVVSTEERTTWFWGGRSRYAISFCVIFLFFFLSAFRYVRCKNLEMDVGGWLGGVQPGAFIVPKGTLFTRGLCISSQIRDLIQREDPNEYVHIAKKKHFGENRAYNTKLHNNIHKTQERNQHENRSPSKLWCILYRVWNSLSLSLSLAFFPLVRYKKLVEHTLGWLH